MLGKRKKEEGRWEKLTLVFFTHFGVRAAAGSGFFSAGASSGFFSATDLLSAAGSARWNNWVGAATGVVFPSGGRAAWSNTGTTGADAGVVSAAGCGLVCVITPLLSLVVIDCWVVIVTKEEKPGWRPAGDETADSCWKDSANRVNTSRGSETGKRGNIFPRRDVSFGVFSGGRGDDS